ncbi:hypothetical protein ARMSODRAFT_741713 [Armillaria solidipes]|uniref:Uncharacterized protein n=1 Tax=Armillaria solidipes TaxID=1076256 RepID=A0A2H3BT09_9AGAR|nr:hypothetical protein ARMSODRAFT_741713 [Armillaria solidipes]
MPLVPLLRTLTASLPHLYLSLLQNNVQTQQTIDPAHRRLYKEVVNRKTFKREIQRTLSPLFVTVLQSCEGKLAKTKDYRRKESGSSCTGSRNRGVQDEAYMYLLPEERLASHDSSAG